MTPEALIDALIDVGRPAMSSTWREDSCIAATAIAIEAFRAFDLDAVPLCVEARILNEPAAAWLREGQQGKPPVEAHQVDVGLVESARDGPLGRTVGRELHLVAWHAPYLIDLTLDQAARPKRGLPLTPMCFVVPEEAQPAFLTGAAPGGWRIPDIGGSIVYRVRPGVTWWKESHNWRRRDAAARSRVVGRVIRALREAERAS